MSVAAQPAAPCARRPSSDADLDAARRIDGLLNRIFLDPMLRGRYPADVRADTAAISDWTFVQRGDLDVIAGRSTCSGVNYYQPDLVSAGTGGGRRGSHPYPGSARATCVFHDNAGPADRDGLGDRPERPARPADPRTHRLWRSMPADGDRERRRLPDEVVPDGRVHDDGRIAYLRGHLAAVHEAIAAGVDVRGYFVWSLLDNFEWAFRLRTAVRPHPRRLRHLRRTLKDSAHWLSRAIRAGGF